MPRITVIMGVYNCKKFELLKRSVDSILNQTFKDFEFLICNDGSTNDTLDMLNELKKADERIRIISYEKNKGLNYALNVCLKEAKGEFIARQDDDDFSKKDRFEKQIRFLDNNKKYCLVGTKADIEDENGIYAEYSVLEKPQKKDFLWNSPFIHPSIMIRKNVLTRIGGYRCAKETRRCEDYDLFMRLYAEGEFGYNLQENLYIYRFINNPKIKYRKMKYRIDEAIVRFKGYKRMGILWKGIPFIIKPVIIGMLPQKILYKIKNKRKQ